MKRAARIGGAVAVLLLAALPVAAQDQSPAAPPATTAAPSPAAAPPVSRFTLDEISERAEDAAAQLRTMIAAISDPADFSALEERVFRFSRRVGDRWQETDQMIRGPLRRAPLETLSSSWRAMRTELVGLRSEVDRRTGQRDADLAALGRMQEAWRWMLDHATAAGAPEQMIERVQATLAGIDATRTQIKARHNQLLVLQDAVSRATQACDDAVARIAEARRLAIERSFTAHTAPLWRHLNPLARHTDPGSPPRSAPDLHAAFDAVAIYVGAYRVSFVFTAVIGLLLIWGLYRKRSLVLRASSASGALPEFVLQAFRAPVATALILTLVASRPLRPDQPAALQQIAFLIGVPAALIVLRPLLDPRLAPAFYAFGGFFIIDSLRMILHLDPVLEQWVLAIEMAAAAAVLFWTASALKTAAGTLVARAQWVRNAGRQVLSAAGLATAFASGAAVLGYLELSDFVGGGALAIVYLGIAVLAFRVAASGVLWLALGSRPLGKLRLLERNRVRAEENLGRVIELVALALWFVFALQRFELLDGTIQLLDTALDAKLKVGELTLTVGRVLSFPLVLGIAWLASRVVIFGLEADVYPRMRLARGVPYALSSIVRYGLLIAGFFAALASLGLDLTRLTVLVSAFGIGLGFGMQQIVNNFVSGLILLFERPVQVGDLVQLKDLSGEVLRIGIRSSTIRTADGAEVIVPNSDLIQNGVTNWTLSDRRRRVTLDLGVAYGTDAASVLALLLDVAKAEPRVMAQPAPEALFSGFGASALQFQLRFWTEYDGWMQLKSDLGVGVQDALRSAGVAMPVTPVEVQNQPAAASPAR